jgi:hypothetical protein
MKPFHRPKIFKDLEPDRYSSMKSRYKPEYCLQVVSFFEDVPLTRMEDVEEIEDENGELKRKKAARAVGCPTLAGFAASIGRSVKDLDNWRDAHPEFEEACQAALAIQADHLVQNASSGKAPPGFAIFMLKNFHGMVDKVESEVSGAMTLESLIGKTISKDEFKKEAKKDGEENS